MVIFKYLPRSQLLRDRAGTGDHTELLPKLTVRPPRPTRDEAGMCVCLGPQDCHFCSILMHSSQIYNTGQGDKSLPCTLIVPKRMPQFTNADFD